MASMLPYPGNVHIDPLEIQIRERHGYCNVIEMEPGVQPWYHDIKRYLKTKEYPEKASGDQKRTIRKLAINFVLSGEVLHKKTPNLNLLRCVDSREAETIMNEVHSGCQIHGDLIHAPPSELHPMSAPWPFVAWGMDVIGPIEPKSSNGHRFILVTIDYFTKQYYKSEQPLDKGEFEIPSLRIIVEAEIGDDEWVKTRLEQLPMIDEKWMAAVCHWQLYLQRIAVPTTRK
nr:uncharacterized protein LOC117277892 [Nicotiana tomentosiformis]